jgi:hypothetical protein
MFTALKNRLPTFPQALSLFGLISLIIYGWTLLWFFWKLPSWEYFMNLDDLAIQFAYMMTIDLLESLTVLSLVLFPCVILPAKWFKDVFLSSGSLLAILGLGYLMYFSSHIASNDDSYPTNMVRLIPVVGLLILFSTFSSARIRFLRKLLEGLADRAVIFSYVFLPIGLVSLLIVIGRNIL